MGSAFELVLKPRKGWQSVDFREIWDYRELFGFLVLRDVKIRYKQTVMGGLWAILQPLIAMLIFGVILNRIVKMPSDGSPYLLFVYVGLVPWTFFMNAVRMSSNSLIGNEQMIRKTYFPRILLPLASVGALGLDMFISLGFIVPIMAYYRQPVSFNLLWLPVFVFGSYLAAAGFGLILSALNVRFRDVKYVVPYMLQMMIFLTPVLYPMSRVPDNFKILLSLNPMAGIVEGYRYTLLGSPVSWIFMGASLAGSMMLFVGGVFFFRRMERTFADVI